MTRGAPKLCMSQVNPKLVAFPTSEALKKPTFRIGEARGIWLTELGTRNSYRLIISVETIRIHSRVM